MNNQRNKLVSNHRDNEKPVVKNLANSSNSRDSIEAMTNFRDPFTGRCGRCSGAEVVEPER